MDNKCNELGVKGECFPLSRGQKGQQMYENLELGHKLKLLFIETLHIMKVVYKIPEKIK